MANFYERQINKINQQAQAPRGNPNISISVGGGGRGPIKGVDAGGAVRAIEVDENGNLRVDQVSGSTLSVNTFNVRGSTVTGFATLALGAETAVVTGIAGTFIGITTITGSNTSGAALQVDIRSGTGGSVVDSLVVPATSVVSKSYQAPMPQPEAAQAWTAKLNAGADISDSPVSITMIGVQQL